MADGSRCAPRYYAYSLFGKNTSGIALATNKTLDPTSPDFKWIDKGMVFESKVDDNYNAIDPNLILDGKDGAWLAFSQGRQTIGVADEYAPEERGWQQSVHLSFGHILCGGKHAHPLRR